MSTKREILRRAQQDNALQSLGFTARECDALRRISLTLHRWAEHECNGVIQRDGADGDGVPYWHSAHDGRRLYRAPDRERGALARLAAMFRGREVTYYVQGDPRGCALYVIRPGDVPAGADVDAYYSRGLAIY